MVAKGTTRRRRWPLLVSVLAIAALGVGSAVVLVGGRRAIAGSRGYCARCHAAEAGRPGTPGHDEVSCQACHAPPEGGTLALLVPWARASREMPEHGEIVTASCTACHEEDGAEWAALMATPGHAQHALDPGPDGCVRCHSATLHGRPSREDEGCMACHEDVPIAADVGFHIDCVACHSFRSHDPTIPPRPGPSAEFGAVQVGPDNVHGAADCRSCHSPHAEPEDAVGRCRRCHRGAIATSVDALPPAHRECRSCHNPHAERSEVAMPCIGCHPAPRVEKARPHGEAHERRPATTAAPAKAAPLDAAARAKLPHKGRCETCHNPHKAESWGARCDQCHEEQSEATGRLPAGSHDSCSKCHEPHSPAPDGEACGACHEREKRDQRVAAKEHRDCLSCHKAHEGSPKRGRVCARCHERAERELRGGEPRHRDCTACHGSHGDSVGRVGRACRECHMPQAQKVEAAVDARHRVCTSCHEPHQMTSKLAGRRCEECHTKVTKAGAAHRGTCTECHEEHGRSSKSALSCQRCHDKVQPPVSKGHGRCQDCHRSHEPAKAAECARCHEAEARGNGTWPDDNPHGKACVTCHRPHDRTKEASCATCHAAQTSREHTGAHKRCVDCHRSHEARPAGSEGWWSECVRCHEPETRAVKGAPERHRRCAECHDNPRWSAPRCATCHEATAGQLLHTTAEHRDCKRCHDSHGTSPPGRDKCLSCHEKMATHYPDAPRCQACHPFAIKGSAKAGPMPSKAVAPEGAR